MLLWGTGVTGQRGVPKPRPRVRAPSGSGWQLRGRGAGQHAHGALVIEGPDDAGRIVVLAPVHGKEKAVAWSMARD